MQSKTLSSNLTLLRKDFTRFSPLWLTYCAGLLIYGYLCYTTRTDMTNGLNFFVGLFSLICGVGGITAAVTLFGYLFEPRECVSIHSLPLRREHLFAVHIMAGFSMFLVPTVLLLLGISPLCQRSVLPLLGFTLLQFLFFFALGIFCVMLTGRRLAAVAMYILLNFGSLLIYYAADTLLLPMLPGVVLPWASFMRLCPPLSMSLGRSELDQVVNWDFQQGYAPYGLHLAVFAAIGAGLLAASLLLYRRRKLERAESFMAFAGLNWLFVYACALFSGCFFISFFSLFSWESSSLLVYWIPMLLGVVMGYFAAAMLVRHSPRVFDRRSFTGFALMAVVLLGSLMAAKFDVFHRVNHIPQTQDVSQVTVRSYYTNQNGFTTDDPEMIERITRLHESALAQSKLGDPNDEYTLHMRLTYRNNGVGSFSRSYMVWGEVLEELDWFLSQPENLLGVQTQQELLESCQNCSISEYFPDGSRDENRLELTAGQQVQFLPILFRDCRDGKVYRSGYSSTDRRSTISVSLTLDPLPGEEYPNYVYIDLPEDAVDSMSWVRQYLPDV